MQGNCDWFCGQHGGNSLLLCRAVRGGGRGGGGGVGIGRVNRGYFENGVGPDLFGHFPASANLIRVAYELIIGSRNAVAHAVENDFPGSLQSFHLGNACKGVGGGKVREVEKKHGIQRTVKPHECAPLGRAMQNSLGLPLLGSKSRLASLRIKTSSA